MLANRYVFTHFGKSVQDYLSIQVGLLSAYFDLGNVFRLHVLLTRTSFHEAGPRPPLC